MPNTVGADKKYDTAGFVAAISPEMALRLEGWLGVERGGRADVWLAGQTAYGLWQARQNGAPHVFWPTPE